MKLTPKEIESERELLVSIEKSKIFNLDSEIHTLFNGRMHVLNSHLQKLNGILKVRYGVSETRTAAKKKIKDIKAIFSELELKKLIISRCSNADYVAAILDSVKKIDATKFNRAYSKEYNTDFLYLPLSKTKLSLSFDKDSDLYNVLSRCVFENIKVHHLSIKLRSPHTKIFKVASWCSKFIEILLKLELPSLSIYIEDGSFIFNILLKLQDSWIQNLKFLKVQENRRCLAAWTLEEFSNFKDLLFQKGFKGHLKLHETDPTGHKLEPHHITSVLINSGDLKKITLYGGYHSFHIMKLADHLNQNTSFVLREVHIWMDIWPFEKSDLFPELEDLIVSLINSGRFRRLSIGALKLTPRQEQRIYDVLKNSKTMISFSHDLQTSNRECSRRERNWKAAGEVACLLLAIRKFKKTWMSQCSKDITLILSRQLLESFWQPLWDACFKSRKGQEKKL